MSNCDKVKLSELIIQKTDTEQIVDMENEHYITLSLYGKGARERVIKDGKYPVPFTGYRVSEGQFIYSRIDARNGAYAIIGPELDGFVVSKDFPVFDINESKVLPHFLRRAVLSDAFINQVKNSSFGATNRMRIKEDIFEGYSIPLPGLSKQQEIVDILDRVETILNSRQQELEKLDALVKARFIEMFGDPIQNPKGWDMPLIEEVVANEKNALKAGPFGSALKKEYYVASGYKIYGQEQVISGDCTFGDYYIDEERYKSLENCAVQPGDVLISLVGTYGKLLIMPEVFEPGIINPRLMKITFDKEMVNPYYFKFFFQSESLKKALSENTHGGTMDILNLGIVRKIKMPLPPLKLQNEFVDFVYQADKSKLLESRQTGFIAKIR